MMQNNTDGIKRKRRDEQLLDFKNSPYYIRISASSVAALCGMHPYQNLPNLLFDLVYQSHLGQLLLQEDAQALGLTLVDAKTHERETMLTLASTASSETKELIKQVLEVSDGTRKLQSIDDVRAIQESIKLSTINAQKDGRLSAKQIESLVEASRGHVSMGFGTCHEDDALDAYESKIGCRVRERNEALMEWRFRRICDIESELGVTAMPMGKATRRCWKNISVLTGADQEQAVFDTTEVHGISDDIADSGNVGANDVGVVEKELTISGVPSSSAIEKEKPFFRIVGAVDGIRDELYMDSSSACNSQDEAHTANTVARDASLSNTSHNKGSKDNGNSSTNVESMISDDEDDSWTLRPIIVECKHRMNEAKVPPPLYDQIQTCIYCYMYGVEDADLVQVIRRKNKREENENGVLGSDVVEQSVGNGQDKIKSNAEDINITITRVSLTDPIYNHNHHWQLTLLPRLASFVDAVYNVRKDDGKRYRLLMARSVENMNNNSDENLWQLLWDECPWLQHCDTAFRKQII
jgi:hypothetical protein